MQWLCMQNSLVCLVPDSCPFSNSAMLWIAACRRPGQCMPGLKAACSVNDTGPNCIWHCTQSCLIDLPPPDTALSPTLPSLHLIAHPNTALSPTLPGHRYLPSDTSPTLQLPRPFGKVLPPGCHTLKLAFPRYSPAARLPNSETDLSLAQSCCQTARYCN
jgi:hypothetical protein